MKGREKNGEIWNLLIVLGSAVLCAVLLASGFLYFYGPSGRYLAGNILLDPAVIEQIHDQSRQPRKGAKAQYQFNHIELSYFDPKSREFKSRAVSLKEYQRFYRMVAGEKSIDEEGSISSYFIRSHPVRMTMMMQILQGRESEASQIFQVVEGVPQGYFRIHFQGVNKEDWIYFYLENVYQELSTLGRNESESGSLSASKEV